MFPTAATWRRSLVAHACLPLVALLSPVFAQADTPRADAPASALPSLPAASTKPRSADEARERIAALRAEIAHHDALYFQKAAPEISDFAYDQLKRALRELERAFPDAAAAAAPSTADAGSALGDDRTGSFPTYRHRERMLGLDKAYDETELRAFCTRVSKQLGRDDLEYVIEPKFDGLAISVTYEKGKLVRAVTRGNGVEGDDITGNVLTIRTLPRELRSIGPSGSSHAAPDLLELRGEVFISFAEFERINREREAAGETMFANPRNLAAGTAKLTDLRELATRKLEIVFYGWGAWEPAATQPKSQQELHAQIRAWGLPGLEKLVVANNADKIWTAVRQIGRDRSTLAFPTDGAVVKLDTVTLRAELGESDHSPRWAIAYKFAPERAETRVTAITIQIGRTGVLTPVAELEPVSLAGSTIARATLHNREALARADVRVGDVVVIEKAGEIIPAIVGVNLARRSSDAVAFAFPTTCPSCDAAVVQLEGEVAVRCPNTACAAQLRRRLEHFASSACVNIDGLGEATIDVLVGRGMLKSIPDIYRLQRADLLSLAGLGERTADNLLAAIERSKRAELWRFIYGLGIPRVGPATAKDFARTFGRLDALANASAGDFASGGRASNADVGAATSAALLAHFAVPENRALAAELLSAGVAPQSPAVGSANARLAGKIFVLTGKLPKLTREEATAKIEAAGGSVGTSVSRRTHFVVAGSDAGAKLDQARKLGVVVIDEGALLRMLEGP